MGIYMNMSASSTNAKRIYAIICCLLTTLLITGCERGLNMDGDGDTRAKIISENHVRTVLDTYQKFSYRWDQIDAGVPPLMLEEFPTDIHLIRSTDKKKKFFFLSVLPLALMGNNEIRQHRNAVEYYLGFIDQGKELSLHQHEELLKIQSYYKVEGDILHDRSARERLLRRVDTIPPSLTLAQAANESGWGLSRFAQQANNIFGEWTFTPGTGLVPKGRPEGEIYEVRRFDSLYASIRSYLRNLNTHRAYRSMRSVRQRLRDNNLPLTGYTLAGEMQFYSTRREAYVREIRAIISTNHLEKVNNVALLERAVPAPVEDAPRKKGLLSSGDGRPNPSET